MGKSLLYTALGLMGIMGTLAIGVVKAETTITHFPDSGIEYTLNAGFDTEQEFTGVGTITISNGDITITMLDRNLGATKAGTGCNQSINGGYCPYDDIYGYHFQWGNNYGFKPCTNNNCTNFPNGETAISNEQIDTAGYGPGNYFSGNIFRLYNGYVRNWSKQNNNNLWGGSGDNRSNERGFGINNENRRGPCPKGFHVPSQGERLKLNKFLTGATNKERASQLYNKLLIPFAGYRDEKVDGLGEYSILWTSATSTTYMESSIFYYMSTDSYFTDAAIRESGYSIRCFYDYYQPYSLTLSFDTLGADNIDPQELIGNSTGSKPENPIKDGYNFNYRYLSGTNDIAFDFENHHITGDSTLYAHWTPIEYTIAYNLNNGTNNPENLAEYTIESDEVILNDPTKDNHTFEGRYSDAEFINKVDSIPTGSTGDITLYAKWKENKKSSGGSSGGGGGMKKDNCPNGDLSPSYYDGKCGAAETNTGDNKTPQPSADSQPLPPTETSPGKGQTSGAQEDEPSVVPPFQRGISEGQGDLSQEQNDAYNFAFKNGITTMDTIQKANLNGYIKRGHLAKMVVNYVTNVLGREIPSDIPASCLSFNDETTARESEEIKDYAIKSCALGLMGIRMKNNEFLPNDYVTRAEFGTVFSRVLWGDKYNLVGSKEKPRYSAHLNTLKEEGIMKMIDNPKMLEKRGYVMIMIMRSTQ